MRIRIPRFDCSSNPVRLMKIQTNNGTASIGNHPLNRVHLWARLTLVLALIIFVAVISTELVRTIVLLTIIFLAVGTVVYAILMQYGIKSFPTITNTKGSKK